MARLPSKIRYGENIYTTSNKINEIIDYLQSQKIVIDNNQLQKKDTPNGIVLTSKLIPRSKPSSGGSLSITTATNYYLCKILSGNNTIGYTVTVYDNFDPTISLGNGLLYFACNVGLNSETLVNQYVIAAREALKVIG